MKATAFRIGQFLAASISGLILIYIISLFQNIDPPAKGEYFYSQFFRSHYTWIAMLLFMGVAFIAAYVFTINPWLTGFSLLIFFPVTAILESAIYRGSHNLIPFEFMMHLVFMAPVALSALAGQQLKRYIIRKKDERRE